MSAMHTTDRSPARLYFADARVEALEASRTLPAKFRRMLSRAGLKNTVAGKSVAIKMHFGAEIGFTTIHPLFVRILVEEIKAAGATGVVVTDSRNPAVDAVPRGYTSEVLGCEVVDAFGPDGKNFQREPIGFGTVDEVLFAGVPLDAEVFIDLSHVKAHGACGFGGALKNIAMGCVPPETRSKLHRLEGGLTIDTEKCTYCLKCYNSCPNEAIIRNDEKKEISFFFHHCTYCQHCVLTCPQGAVTMGERKYGDFAEGMARVTTAFLKRFQPENLFFINMLLNITMYCDCWGFSSPSLVPDIGILVGSGITAIDTASLDMVKEENLLPGGLPKNRSLGEGNHLFERIHGKDPYLMVRYLAEHYGVTTEYEIEEVR